MRYILTLITMVTFVFSKGQTDYFQQEVNTTIDVKLDDKNHFIHAFEKIEYINNSPDKLDYLIIHIWPNAYKNNTSALATQLDENGEVEFHFASSNDRGFIDSLSFTIEGKKVFYENYNDEPDIIKLRLNEPILPGGKVLIETPFRVKIPKGIYSRLGHIGESYQMTQWFPKPAVYDDEGWHPIPYLSQGEFYSEYGSYDVKITLPKNYVVGSTGDLINGEDELKFLDSLVTVTESRIKSNDYPQSYYDADLKFPESSKELKTLHYHQKNVHDFAWFADKRYNVLKGEVKLPSEDRKVTVWSMFTENEFSLWTKSIEYLVDATYFYSLWTGPYPYNQVTAVDGSISAGGGMEYPNVTVIGESYTDFGLEQVIVHEVGHNWFYGILGSNERENAWMDEGLNTFTENRYTENKYPDKGLDFGIPQGLLKKVGLDQFGSRGMYDLGYIFNARRNYDQPIQTRSDLFTPTNYGGIVYGKTGIGFDYLLAYLGDDIFDECMLEYFDRWKFKHPSPSDIRQVFEEVSGKDLSWLFDDFIKTNKKIDYKIQKVKFIEDFIEVTIKNKELLSPPVALSMMTEGMEEDKVWLEGFGKSKTIKVKDNGYSSLLLDFSQDMPTIDRTDDCFRLSGMFKKMDPIKFKFAGSFEKPEESHIYWTPSIAGNAQDGAMLGLALYNKSIPERKFEWLAVPMYGTASKRLTGTGKLTYNHNHNSGLFRKSSISYDLKSYSISNSDSTFNDDNSFEGFSEVFNPWIRHQIGIETELNTGNLRRSRSKHFMKVRGINLKEEFSFDTRNETKALVFTYELKNIQVLKPASIKFDVISLSSSPTGSFTGVSVEGKLRKNYNVDLRGFELRFFAGQTLMKTGNSGRYNWFLGGQRGVNDYLYDYTLLGRFQGHPNMLNQQTTGNHGGFNINSVKELGNTDKWMVAANFKIEVPWNLPLGLYVDGGMYPSTLNGSNIIKTQFNGGIYLPIRKDIFEIYVPLFYSEDIQNHLNYYDVGFLQTIRFKLNLNALNPFKMIKDIQP